MEVPVRDEQVVLDEDERVVGRGVQLDRHRVVDVVEEVARGAVHLRGAAQRVRVLHLVAPAVGLVDRRALEQGEDVRGRRLLAAQRAQRVHLREEARPRALQRLDRERARDVRRLGEATCADEAERAERRHELCAVHERQPFLRLQRLRFEAGPFERFPAREALAAEPRLPLADQRERQVRERREITARPDGATARDDREDSAVETLEQELDELGPRAGPALRQRVRAEQHRGADDLVRVRLPHAARVAAQEAQLQLLGQLLRDRLRDEAAEPGVHTVGVLAPSVRGAIDDRAGLDHPPACGLGKRRGRARDRNRPHVVDGQILAREADRRSRGHGGESSFGLHISLERRERPFG